MHANSENEKFWILEKKNLGRRFRPFGPIDIQGKTTLILSSIECKSMQ